MKKYQKFIGEYFDWLNKKTEPLCETTVSYYPDFGKARSLGTRYFYDPSVLQFLRCYADNISEFGERRFISQYEKDKTLSKGAFGAALVYNDMVLVKVPLVSDDGYEVKENLITSMAEFVIGNELNKLELPNLMKTYSAIKAPIPADVLANKKGDKDIQNLMLGRKADEGVYLLVEMVKSKADFRYMHNKWAKENKFHEILVCFLQIFYTLWIAYEKLGFVHCDLHDSNILVVEMDEPVAIPYFLPNGETVVLVTPYVVKIIDFGMSRINIPVPKHLQGKYGRDIDIIGVDWDKTNQIKADDVKKLGGKFAQDRIEQTAKSPSLNTPFFDLFKLCGFMLYYLYRQNEYYGRIFSVVFEYIYFLNRYVNFTSRKYTLSRQTLHPDNNLDTYFDFTPRMAKEAEQNLSMQGFHEHLQWVLFTYLDVKYVFSSNQRKKINVPREVYWLECNDKHIQRLVKEGFSGMNSCRTMMEAKKEMDYNLYNVSTLADYLEKRKGQWTNLKTKDMVDMANHAYLRGKFKVENFIKDIKKGKKNYKLLVTKHKIMIEDLMIVRKFLGLKDNRLEEDLRRINKFINW